ncbi:IS3 family transposase [Mesonia aestuariivivens]|uniref:IS3 family transposase n=1 Tax=Mesonia aestuariivivens TaxID=2796128 RepID=A0ABS6W6E0_9FLAO|nr:IS3 family transposase [Mesonia aestuariivivens]
MIKKEFHLSQRRYGSTRIAEQLKRKDHCISRYRVAKIMKVNHWVSKHKRKFKATTNSNHNYLICRNLLNINFNSSRLNAAWFSDITHIQTNQG